MPGTWLPLLAGIVPTFVAAMGQEPKTQTFGNVTVSYNSGHLDVASQAYVFSGGVTLKYDVTTVHADEIAVQQKAKFASAVGHVHVNDPAGTIDGDDIQLWWDPAARHAIIRNAVVKIDSVTIRAKTADIKPDIWVLKEAYGSTSRAHPNWYGVGSRTVIIHPGKYGDLKHPSLYILGHKVLNLPDRSFNLDPRSEGVGLPALTYNPGQGFGPSWGGGLLLDHATNLEFGMAAFPNAYPVYGASVSRSLLPDNKLLTFLGPGSELGERFSGAYLDDIHVASPGQEQVNYRFAQRTVSFDSFWNSSSIGRGPGLLYDKAAETVYTLGGSEHDFGYVSQFRLQDIRQLGQSFLARGIYQGALSMPSYQLAPSLKSMMRLDTEDFLGPHRFGWIHGAAGLAYEPIKQIRVGAGIYSSETYGTPDYVIDRLVGTQGEMYRIDLNLGPTKFSYIAKYDDSLKWFDREYSISQDVGCFEPFILYRQYPEEYQLGMRLSVGSLMDLIGQRNFEHKKPVSTVISPDPNGNP